MAQPPRRWIVMRKVRASIEVLMMRPLLLQWQKMKPIDLHWWCQ